MTREELEKIQVKIDNLKAQGFFDTFIDEVLGIALRRYISIGGNYIECLEFVIYDEISRCEFAVIGENDAVKPTEKDVN